MINIHSNGNRTSYGIKHFVLDTIEDIKELDKNKLTPGSTIFIIASSKYYILNGKKQWIEINPYCMGHSSGEAEYRALRCNRLRNPAARRNVSCFFLFKEEIW